MSIDVKPHREAHIPVTGGCSNQLKTRINDLLEQFQSSINEVVVFNFTRDCQVTITIENRILRVRVTNAKEDETFRFEVDQTTEKEDPTPDTFTPMPKLRISGRDCA